jgi:hypothetical protein
LSKVPLRPEALVSHRNASTAFQGRLLIVQRHRAGWPQAHIAKAMGISRKCVKTWIDPYAAEGEAGLHDRSSRPHSCPRRTSSAVEHRILQLRRRERRWPDWIGAELGVPTRTVSRVLARHRVPRLCTLDPLTGEALRSSKSTAVRLGTRQARRAGPHGRQEDRPHPRRWGLARSRPRGGIIHPRPQHQGRVRLRPLPR